jgi:hypothetical protein
VFSSELLVAIYKTTWCHNPEDHNQCLHHYEQCQVIVLFVENQMCFIIQTLKSRMGCIYQEMKMYSSLLVSLCYGCYNLILWYRLTYSCWKAVPFSATFLYLQTGHHALFFSNAHC